MTAPKMECPCGDGSGCADLAAPIVDLRVGDCRAVSRSLAAGSVSCVVTSPPYYSLRSYSTEPVVWGGDETCTHQWQEVRTKRGNGGGGKTAKQSTSPGSFVSDTPERVTSSQECGRCGAIRCELGLEPSPSLYIDHLVEVFECVRPALHSTGMLAVNLADSFARDPGKGGSGTPNGRNGRGEQYPGGGGELPEGNLLLIPARFALAMQAAGWILRSAIVLRKQVVMPESQQGTRWEPCRRKVAGTGWGGVDGSVHPSNALDGLTMRRQNSGGFEKPHEGVAEWEPCPGCRKCLPNDGFVLRRGSWRPSRSHEFLFLFAKTEDYFASGEAVRETALTGAEVRWDNGKNGHRTGTAPSGTSGRKFSADPSSRNARDVQNREPTREELLEIIRAQAAQLATLQGPAVNDVLAWVPDPTPEKHYAAYPPWLPAFAIQSCSPVCCCSTCGAPYAPVIRRGAADVAHQRDCGANGDGSYHGAGKGAGSGAQSPGGAKANILRSLRKREVGEQRPTCPCGAEPARATVYDPFGGSGTTGIVARDLGRACVLAELNPEYAEIARKRLARERYNPQTQRNKRDRHAVEQLDLFADPPKPPKPPLNRQAALMELVPRGGPVDLTDPERTTVEWVAPGGLAYAKATLAPADAATIRPPFAWLRPWQETGYDPHPGERYLYTGQDGAVLEVIVTERRGNRLRLECGKIVWEFSGEWPALEGPR